MMACFAVKMRGMHKFHTNEGKFCQTLHNILIINLLLYFKPIQKIPAI